MQLSPDVQANLRAQYQRQVDSGRLVPLGRDLIQASLAALDGSCDVGREMLRTAVRVHAAVPPSNVVLLASLVSACFSCNDIDLAAEVLGVSHGMRVGLAVDEGNRRPAQASTVHCTVSGTGEIAFAFPPAFLRAPGYLTRLMRWLCCVPLFARCARLPGGRTGRTRLHLIDGAFRPGLGFCARTDEVTLIPDPDFLRTRGYGAMRAQLDRQPIPWGQRRPVALWRGAANGQVERGQDWRSLPRVRLCGFMAGPHAHLFDLGINTNSLPAADPGHALLPASGLMRPGMEAAAFQAWRYLIDIDGFTNAWSGLFQKLLTGSTVLKVGSARGWRQWYYDRLTPWTHFVPVQADMADLPEKLGWLIAHDDEARRIGEAGRELAAGLTLDAETQTAAETIAGVLS